MVGLHRHASNSSKGDGFPRISVGEGNPHDDRGTFESNLIAVTLEGAGAHSFDFFHRTAPRRSQHNATCRDSQLAADGDLEPAVRQMFQREVEWAVPGGQALNSERTS